MFAQDRIKDRNMMSNMRLIQTLMVAIFATLIAFPAFAQDDGLDVGNDGSPAAPEAPAAPTAQPKSDSKGTPVATTKDGKPKRTTIDFEDELVEGKTKNPENRVLSRRMIMVSFCNHMYVIKPFKRLFSKYCF